MSSVSFAQIGLSVRFGATDERFTDFVEREEEEYDDDITDSAQSIGNHGPFAGYVLIASLTDARLVRLKSPKEAFPDGAVPSPTSWANIRETRRAMPYHRGRSRAVRTQR
jgi:hypothetical protein